MSIAIIPGPHPTNSRWIQRVVRSNAGQTSFILHDHSRGIYLAGGPHDSLKVAEVEFKTLSDLANDDLANTPIHVVAHPESRAVFLADFFVAPAAGEDADSRPRIVLQVGRPESVADDSLASDNVVWISMKSRVAYIKVADWLPQFLNLSFQDAVKIANVTDRAALNPDFQQKYAQLLDITHPGDPSARLTFHLLCEAWLINNGQPSICGGLAITPPGTLGNWLAQFRVGNLTPDKAAVAAMVGKALETQAKGVLNAAEVGDMLMISTAATAFEKAFSQSLSTAGGAE